MQIHRWTDWISSLRWSSTKRAFWEFSPWSNKISTWWVSFEASIFLKVVLGFSCNQAWFFTVGSPRKGIRRPIPLPSCFGVSWSWGPKKLYFTASQKRELPAPLGEGEKERRGYFYLVFQTTCQLFELHDSSL